MRIEQRGAAKMSPDWRAIFLGGVASLVVVPVLQFVPVYPVQVAMIATPLVASAVAGLLTRNFGDEFIDGVVGAWAGLLAFLAGWAATMALLGFNSFFIFVAGHRILFQVVVIGFPAGGILGAFVGHFVGRLSPSVQDVSMPV